jgi:hypothetical protein
MVCGKCGMYYNTIHKCNPVVKATWESLKHWEEMVERIKWLMESELLTNSPYWFWNYFPEIFIKIIGTFWSLGYCYCNFESGCKECPLEKTGYGCLHIDSPWSKLCDCGSFEIFCEIADTEMIPALKKAYTYVVTRK